MNEMRTVVVGVDGSQASLRAVDWAAREAAARAATLTVYCVAADRPLQTTLIWESHLTREHADRVVADAVQRARRVTPDLPVTGQVLVGMPSRQLVARSPRDGVLVVGSRGLGAFTGLLLGSVSEQVAEHGAGPVVVVRGETVSRALPVLVGVDGSAANEPAVEYAFAAADRNQVPLIALCAVPPVWIAPTLGYPTMPVPEDHELEAAAERVLTEALRIWADKYPAVRVEHRPVVGRPARELIQLSSSCGLVVVGSRGHGQLASLLLGSVSRHVLRHADCPVAVVRS